MRICFVQISSEILCKTSLTAGYFYSILLDNNLIAKKNFYYLEFSLKDDTKLIINLILKKKPTLLCFSCYVWNINLILKLIRIIKKKKIKIILGGPYVGPLSDKLISENKEIDIIVRGEAEQTFMELVQIFKGKKSLRHTLGITYRKEGKVFINPDRPLIKNLDEIPSPFKYNFLHFGPKREAMIEVSRGCPFSCRYCFYSKGDRSIRDFSLKRIESDLMYIKKQKFKYLYLLDPTFNFRFKRTKEICELIYKIFKGKVKIHVEIKAELVTLKHIEYFEKANIWIFEIGLQTTNPTALKIMNRNFDLKRFRTGFNLLKKMKNKPSLDICLINGLPGDNFLSVKKTIDFARALNPTEIYLFPLQIFPGTDFFINAEKYGIRFNKEPPHEIYFNKSFSCDEIKKAKAYARKILKGFNTRMPLYIQVIGRN